jgi:hypothetical protein
MKIKIYKDPRLYRIPEFNIFRWRKSGVEMIYKGVTYQLERICSYEFRTDLAIEMLDNILEQELPKQVEYDVKDVKNYLRKKYRTENFNRLKAYFNRLLLNN